MARSAALAAGAMASKMPSRAWEKPSCVAGDQRRIVEIVAGIHAHARRQAAAHGDLLAVVEQRNLDAVDLLRMGRQDRQADLHRRHVVGVAPVAVQRGIEHLAQPVDQDRLAHLGEDAAVDLLVIRRAGGAGGERPARHQDDPPARGLDRLALFLVGADHVVDAGVRPRRQMVRAGAARNQPAAVPRLRSGDRAPDQLARGRPVQPHAALGGVHRFGDAESERPEMLAIGQCRLPVEGGVEPGVCVGVRVVDDMGGGIGDAGQGLGARRFVGQRLRQTVGLDPAVARRQVDRGHDQISSSGTSTQRRSRQLR